jgi:cyclopropane fatty-acyl-phospholipid synthase-like methyltransferase
MESNWYEHFFHGVALDVWRRAVPAEQTQAEAHLLEKMLEPAPGARLLDVPCGNGRHSVILAARGYRTTGVDIAKEFIREAQGRAAASDLRAEFLQGDMRHLPWQSEFDGAFCLGNSFGYLEHAGTVEFLSALCRTLKPGARFVLETGVAAESILPKLQERGWMQLGDILFLSARRYEAAESRLYIQYTFVRGAEQETREASQQVYTAAELRRLLEEAGLRTLALYSSLDQQPYQIGSPRLLLVAKKAVTTARRGGDN